MLTGVAASFLGPKKTRFQGMVNPSAHLPLNEFGLLYRWGLWDRQTPLLWDLRDCQV